MNGLATQFVSFGAVGAVGTVAHYTLFVALVEWAAVDPVPASVAGAALGALVNYLLNYHYTFRSDRRHRDALPRFLAIAGLGLSLNTLCMALFVDSFGMHYLVAQVLATLSVLIWNFFANRHWTFAKDAA